MLDRAILGKVIIHHLNPISEDDILQRNTSALLNPENAICVSFETHNAIHYGAEPRKEHVYRAPNDTCPWRSPNAL